MLAESIESESVALSSLDRLPKAQLLYHGEDHGFASIFDDGV